MLYFEQILLHFFIIISPVTIYQLFVNDELIIQSNWQPRRLLFVLMLLPTILLLHFPLFDVGKTSFNFHSLLVMYTILYSNRKTGLFLILTVNIYHILIDFPDGIASIVQLPLIYILPLILQPSWNHLSKKLKYTYSFVLSIISFILFFFIVWDVILLTEQNFTVSNAPLFIILITAISYCFTFVLMIFFTEFFKESRKLKLLAQDSEKMTVVSDLAAGIAHEVRNPLTVVKGFVQLVEKEVSDTSKVYMKLVLSEIDRAESIISDYLHLAGRNNQIKKKISVTSMLKNVHSVMSSYTNMSGIVLLLETEEDLFIEGDENKMKQVCYNLIKNAAEAITHNRGKIILRVFSRSDNAVIEIIDNGIGMDTQERIRVGEPFYTSKETGTGLGVMVTKAIITDHRGAINYESEKGIGTTVRIIIPKLKDDTTKA